MGLVLTVYVITITLPLPLKLNAAELNIKPVFNRKAMVIAAKGKAVR